MNIFRPTDPLFLWTLLVNQKIKLVWPYSTHTHHLLCTGQNGLPPAPDNLHLRCSYHLHHHFLSTWGVVMLIKTNKQTKKLEVCTFKRGRLSETEEYRLYPSVCTYTSPQPASVCWPRVLLVLAAVSLSLLCSHPPAQQPCWSAPSPPPLPSLPPCSPPYFAVTPAHPQACTGGTRRGWGIYKHIQVVNVGEVRITNWR